MNIYLNNTTSQFITKLPKHFDLTGDWIVSLKEISVPIAMVNIAANTYMFEIRDTASNTTTERQRCQPETMIKRKTRPPKTGGKGRKSGPLKGGKRHKVDGAYRTESVFVALR